MASETAAQQIVDVVTPAAGESVTEGTILQWRVGVGETIRTDDTIVEISTDKVDVELPSPATGTVAEILVAEGDTVTVGQVIARIAVGGQPPRTNGSGGSRAQSDENGGGAGRAAPTSSGASSNGGAVPAPASAAGSDGGGGVGAGARAAAGGGERGTLVDVITPAAGESVTEGVVLEWRVGVGDAIATDHTIVEISTDKVDVELPSPATGTVAEILVAEGDTVTVGQVIARIAVGAGSQPSAPTAGDGGGGGAPQARTA
ncbi:MAG: biotin/lipoyl-containing protein, partial [Solirubrobacteraceae bacterium]